MVGPLVSRRRPREALSSVQAGTEAQWNHNSPARIENRALLRGTSQHRLLQSPPAHSNDEIHIAHGCLLIPVAVAFWWYWTKKQARRVMRRITRHSDPCGPSVDLPQVHSVSSQDETTDRTAEEVPPYAASANDKFTSWEDVRDHETEDHSVRFVRWIKGKNSKARRRMEAVSRFTLRRQQQQQGNKSTSAAATPILSMCSSGDDTTSLSTIDTVPHRAAWQCIHDTGVEICILQKTREPMHAHTDNSIVQGTFS